MDDMFCMVLFRLLDLADASEKKIACLYCWQENPYATMEGMQEMNLVHLGMMVALVPDSDCFVGAESGHGWFFLPHCERCDYSEDTEGT